MICNLKHIKPPTDDWSCPNCGSSDFYIDDGPCMECEEVHARDILCCGKCKHTMTATAYFAYLRKKLNIVPCPCCKGNGFVKNTDRKVMK